MRRHRVRCISFSKIQSTVQVAAACGLRAINVAEIPHIISISSIESPPIDCLPAEAAGAAYPGMYIALPEQDLYKCSRCPTLTASTNYTVFLAATEGSSEYSGTATLATALQVRTLATPTAPRLLSEPVVASVDSSSITVNFQEQELDNDTSQAIGVAYALTYARISAPFFPGYSLDFPVAEPSAEDIIAYARLGHSAHPLPTAAPDPSSSPGDYGGYGGRYGGYSGWDGEYGGVHGITIDLNASNRVVPARGVDASDTADSVPGSSTPFGGLGGVIAAGYMSASGADTFNSASIALLQWCSLQGLVVF